MALAATAVASFRYPRHLLAFALLALMSAAVLAEPADAGFVEQRVDRLLWQLVNDERFSHLQVAANYERLRAQLIEQACLVSAASCAQADDAVASQARAITTEMTPEQLRIVEQLLLSLDKASVSTVQPSVHLMVTASE
jgi:endonuclease/exonuclease/phosphatase (EEP) superfamily protein YafD